MYIFAFIVKSNIKNIFCGEEMEKYKTSPFLYRLLAPCAVLLFRIIFHPSVKGRENIPLKGAAVIAGNHRTFFDCFMVMAGTYRCIHFLAKSELFKYSFTNWFLKSAGIIPVHRNRRDKDALISARAYLEKGGIVGIFPEGTVNKDPLRKTLPFRLGAVKMARDTGAPIVPFTLRGRCVPIVGNPQIIFHKPYYIKSDDLIAENDKLKEKIISKM